jgi:ribosomal 30S subunit maturation factor RimM
VVQRPDGSALGLVSGFYELPGGLTLEIQGPKREFLLPFRKEFVLELDRTARRMVVQPPEGLVEESE